MVEFSTFTLLLAIIEQKLYTKQEIDYLNIYYTNI